MKGSERRGSGLGRYGGAFLVVLISTLLAELLFRGLGTTRLSMIFLAGVLVSAVRWGSGPGYLAAILAFIVYNFYLVDPRFTIQFASAEDFLVLTVFLAVAMLTGNLAGRVRDEAARTEARARTTDALLEASREFSSSADEAAIRDRLTHHVSVAARGTSLVCDADLGLCDPAEHGAPVPLLKDALEAPTRAPGVGVRTLEDGRWSARPLVAAGETLGVVGWRGGEESHLGADELRLINVLVDMAATAIARARLAAGQAELAAQVRTEKLRDALLSSLSHDLRTPLASILASASSLREFGEGFSPLTRADLVVTIQEEAERLNLFVTNLLDMTKLESGALAVESVDFSLAEVVERVVRRAERRAGEQRLDIDLATPDLVARGDPVLAEHALTNVVENAMRFSPAPSRVIVSGDRLGALAVIEISDEGPGVPDEELEQIFEKFYRSPGTAATLQGTGLGLSISKGLIEAMGGSVTARGRKGRRGLVVSMMLPIGEM